MEISLVVKSSSKQLQKRLASFASNCVSRTKTRTEPGGEH